MELYQETLLAAATTGSGVIKPSETKERTFHRVYVEGSSGVSAGVVTVETAIHEDYAGTWDSLGTVTVVASTVDSVQVEGVFGAIRARISTTVADGTVTVVYIAQ